MSERFIGKVTKAILVGSLAVGCSPSSGPTAEAPGSQRYQDLCGEGQMPYSESWSRMHDEKWDDISFPAHERDLYSIALGMIAQSNGGHESANIEVINGKFTYDFDELERRSTETPNLVPTPIPRESVVLHSFDCGPINPGQSE